MSTAIPAPKFKHFNRVQVIDSDRPSTGTIVGIEWVDANTAILTRLFVKPGWCYRVSYAFGLDVEAIASNRFFASNEPTEECWEEDLIGV